MEEVINLDVTYADGSKAIISVPTGISLMEALRDSGVEELLAICGGCCACATCHVYIEDSSSDLSKPASDDEDELLNDSQYRQSNSRLSCQIALTRELDNLAVRVAPDD